MRATEVVSTTPIQTEQSVRGDEIRVLTSCRAGKIVPVAYSPLLREDRVSRGNIRLKLEMSETVRPLMNAVNVTAFAHFVPFSAFERFTGMDTFNRSYQGVGEPHDGQPVEFFKTIIFNDSTDFWPTLGIHHRPGARINSAPLEAYNTLVNWRRAARSSKLPARNLYSTTLAEAFWRNPNMWHIVPDFDAASMDGEVELSWTNPRARVSGIGSKEAFAANVEQSGVRESGFPGRLAKYNNWYASDNSNHTVLIKSNSSGFPEVFAEMAESGLRLSLANIELAKKTASFAKLREQYSALDDDHLIDLLMEGVRVPEEALRQPILLDRKSTIFGYSERHAMDGASLDKSVTTGMTQLDLTFRTPPMNTGGIILITVEIVPEQLFERQRDHFLAVDSPDRLPNFMRDYLDPEKVDVVPNEHVDVMHSDPDAVFGYAPLNHAWRRSLARVGGRYYRPKVDGFVEDRQRFWAVEQKDPALTSDFYLVPDNLPHTVFADSAADPFEILALGNIEIVGNTVFGRTLSEDEGHYDAVSEQVDVSRIRQP